MAWLSKYCGGELCGICIRANVEIQATHKVGEEMFDDDPNPYRHNLTQYVCENHFAYIFGQGK